MKEVTIMQPNPTIDQTDTLSRYIDRFLFAEGWRIGSVERHDGDGQYHVTLTQHAGFPSARSVTRSALSAGEATFMACSSARQLDISPAVE
jgi:hypothetical protein